MLNRLRFVTAGESHGPKLTAILEGVPAGFAIDSRSIDSDLERRQKPLGSGQRMKIERDKARITAGVTAGLTTGGPISLEIENLDWKNWKNKEIPPMITPRPGHADLPGAIKYCHGDLRLSLERASARETAARVAVGSVCRQLLRVFAIEIGGYCASIGGAEAELSDSPDAAEYLKRFELANKDPLSCPDKKAVSSMRAELKKAEKRKDTLGGVIEAVALNVPPGLGSYAQWDRRLDARLAMAMVGIQAVKGVEIGPAFKNSGFRGTEVHDQIFMDGEGRLYRKSNNAGGIEGGISNGEPITLRLAMKPISTTLNPLKSVNLVTGKPQKTEYERSDTCAVPRAVPVAEAMFAIVIADALLEKLGGDSQKEIAPRFELLKRGRIEDFDLDNRVWRFCCDD